MPAAHDAYPGFDWIVKQTRDDSVPLTEKTFELNGFTAYSSRLGKDRVLMGLYPMPKIEDERTRLLFDRDTAEEQLNYVMFNASTAPKSPKGRLHDLRVKYRNTHTIFQDSGGFQLYSGAEDFIDPEAVGVMHQRYAHEGVGLDVPLGIITDQKVAVAAARVQYWNNVQVQNTFKRALFVTSHGAFAEARITYLKELLKLHKKDPIENLCIAALRPIVGLFKPTLAQIAAHLSYVLHRVDSKRIHLLGVSTFETHVLAAAASKLFDRTITADSSRHILAGAGGACLNTYLRDVGQRSRKDGKDISPNIHLIRGCNCRICHSLKYDYLQHHSRFLQTHSFNSLVESQKHSREIGLNYLNDVHVPFYNDMAHAMRILQQPKEESEATLLKVGSAKRVAQGLFGGMTPVSGAVKQLHTVLLRYAEFHKKPKSALE